MHYGEKISEIRTNLNMSIRQFANLVGYSYSYISKLEKGKSNPQGKDLKPSIDVLKNICEKSNYPFQKFLYETNYLPEYKINDENDTNNKFNIAFGERLKESRKNKNITQQELADKLNIDRSTLSRYENGKIDLSVRDCEIIADAVGVSTDYLLGRETEKDIYETVPNIYPVEGICTFKEIGTVRAGYGGYAIEEPTGRKIIIPIEMLRGHSPEDFFVLRVNGNSMYPKLINGDNILCLRCNSVDNGAIAVVLYNGEEATVKKVRYGQDWLELIPANPEYMTKRITGPDLEQVRILGQVIKLIRDF